MVGSPAEKAGLQAGDRIVAVDGKAVKLAEELVKAVRERKPGDKVKLTLLRGKDRKTVEVTLGTLAAARERPEGRERPRPQQTPRPVPQPQNPQPVKPSPRVPLPLPGFNPPQMFEKDGVRVWVWGVPPEARKELEGKFRQWVEQYRKEHPGPAYLGVTIEKAEGGLQVTSVDLDSPAGKVGLHAGDLIVRYDGKTADDPEAFAKAIGAKKPGDTVTLEVNRGKLRTEVLVKLAERPREPRTLLNPWRQMMPGMPVLPWGQGGGAGTFVLPGGRDGAHLQIRPGMPGAPVKPGAPVQPGAPANPQKRPEGLQFRLPGGGQGTFQWQIAPGRQLNWRELREQIQKQLQQQGVQSRDVTEQIDRMIRQLERQQQLPRRETEEEEDDD
jgi:membrane-associated protease RseP (regulator of RpoE activity)